MQTYAGIDLHSSNNFVGVINDKDKILYGKRHANRLDDVLRALKPFSNSLQGVAGGCARMCGRMWDVGRTKSTYCYCAKYSL